MGAALGTFVLPLAAAMQGGLRLREEEESLRAEAGELFDMAISCEDREWRTFFQSRAAAEIKDRVAFWRGVKVG